MKDDNCETRAPESYLTFWEPIVVDAPPSPPASGTSGATRDAYQEFVNVAEDAPVTLHVERI
jgi:hypothetical protein